MIFSSKGNSKPKKVFPSAAPTVSKENWLYVRVIDKDIMSKREALAYARIYLDLAPADPHDSISVQRVKTFLEQVVCEENPSMYQKIMSYYEVIEDNNFSEQKAKKIKNQIEYYFQNVCSLKNAMMYSVNFEEAANQMASKLDAPEDMSILERVKWLRVWLVILKDHEFFWPELDQKRLFRGANVSNYINSINLLPEVLIHLNEIYFSCLPDEEISLEIIQDFLATYPEDVQKEVFRFAEFDSDIPYTLRFERIRINVKQKLFPNSCRSDLSFFCTKFGIKHFAPRNLELAVKAYKNGGISTLPEMEGQIVDVFNNYRKKSIVCYKYGENVFKGKTVELGVTSEHELELYAILYKWLLAHPDFRFGIENKTLEEYGMDNLLLDSKSAVSAWILDSGLAADESDINWDLAEVILKPTENESVFWDYFNGQISAQEVFNTIGFNSEKLARMCCSFKGLICFDKAEFDRVFRRVHMFGIDRSSVSDRIYVELYRFLIKTGLPCGAKRKPISSQGLRYSV